MKSDLLARSPMLALPLGALFLFLIVFFTVVFVTMKRKAPAYDPIARLPLDDGDPEPEPAPKPIEQNLLRSDEETRS